ncbi:cell wall protein [Fusarium sp. NRRL 52700]|nr:cell wall protein [Fusarium sp. NRRL 52700]
MRPIIIITAITASCTTVTSLSSQPKPVKQASTFQIVHNRNEKVKAANNTLYIGSPKQGACCNQLNAEDAATFYLQDEELFLYSPGNPKQQVMLHSTKASTECE